MSIGIFFDLDGTVFQYDRSWTEIFETAVPDAPPRAIETFLVGYFEYLDVSSSDPYVRAFERIASEHDVEIDPKEARDAYVAAELEACTVSEEMERTLGKIAASEQIGVIANGHGGVIREKLARHGLRPLFDELVLSGEVGVTKPNPEIFHIARERLDTDQFVYVGDSYETDIEPAEEAGFRTVHVRNDAGPTVSVDEASSIDLFTQIPK